MLQLYKTCTSSFHLVVIDTLESIFCIFSSFLKMLHFTVLILSTWKKEKKGNTLKLKNEANLQNIAIQNYSNRTITV